MDVGSRNDFDYCIKVCIKDQTFSAGPLESFGGWCISVVTVSGLTFPLKAFFAEEADHGEELGDLLQVHDGCVVQMNNGHRLLVIG